MPIHFKIAPTFQKVELRNSTFLQPYQLKSPANSAIDISFPPSQVHVRFIERRGDSLFPVRLRPFFESPLVLLHHDSDVFLSRRRPRLFDRFGRMESNATNFDGDSVIGFDNDVGEFYGNDAVESDCAVVKFDDDVIEFDGNNVI